MSAHTKGRLVAGQYRIAEISKISTFHGVAVEGDTMPIAVTGPTFADAADAAVADARRLAACWNAFEGMPIEAPEELTLIGGVQQLVNELGAAVKHIAKLQAQIDGLTAELSSARAILVEKGGAE